jgi:DNA-binding NarL/FixJ family response regulator
VRAPGTSPPARPDGRARLVVADDHARSRQALCALLGTCADLVVVGEAADGAHAIELVAHEQPEIVVLDLDMPILDGLQATIRIKKRWPSVRVLVLSMDTDAHGHALNAGADAFVAKGDPEDVLLETVRSLCAAP